MVFVNPMFRLNQITQPIGIYCFLTSPLFQSHLRLRPLLSCTNITSFLLSLPLSPQLNQRNPPLLSTPIAPRRSLITVLELFMCLTFEVLCTCWHGHCVIHSHFLSRPVQSLQHVSSEWRKLPLVLPLSQSMVAHFSLLPMRTSCLRVCGLVPLMAQLWDWKFSW